MKTVLKAVMRQRKTTDIERYSFVLDNYINKLYIKYSYLEENREVWHNNF